MKYLVLDACARKESRTRKIYEAYLNSLDGEIKILKLYDLDLKPLNEEMLNRRDLLISLKKFDNEMFGVKLRLEVWDLV